MPFQKTYSKADIDNFRGKDMRISFLSILSSLCTREKGEEIFTDKVVEKAFEINEKLYQKYPYVENTPTSYQKPQGGGKFNATSDYKCEFCGAVLVKTKSGDAFRCPNWKKDGTGCQGTYIKPGEVERARNEDTMTDDANNPPPEYGG